MRYTTALLAATAAAVSAQTYPAAFSVDFLAPSTEGPFKRAYPFPFIFAIKGKPEIWPADLVLQVQLQREGDEFIRESVDVDLSALVPKLPSKQDTFFGVVGMFSAVDAPAEGGGLGYDVSYWQYCEDVEGGPENNSTDDGSDNVGAVGKRGVDNYPGLSTIGGGFLEITFDDEEGTDPVIKPEIKGCDARAMSVMIEGKETDRCILYEPDYEESDEKDCSLVYPEGFEDMVEKKLKELEKCGDDTRPGSSARKACNAMPFLLESEEEDEKDKDKDKGDTDEEEKDEPGNGGNGGASSEEAGDETEATEEKPDDDKSGASLVGMSWYAMLAVPVMLAML